VQNMHTHTHTQHIHIPFPYMMVIWKENDQISTKINRICTYPILVQKKYKIWKQMLNMLFNSWPTRMRVGQEWNNDKYAEYYQICKICWIWLDTLNTQFGSVALCCNWNMQNIISFAQYSVCVWYMPQCPAASGCPSSDCVAAIDPCSSPVDSSIGGSQCGRDRPGFGCPAVYSKLLGIQYYRVLNIINLKLYIVL
jgi:hypothetical protein